MKKNSNGKPVLVLGMLGRLGDIIAAEPAFRTLRAMYPERHFIWITSRAFSGVLRKAPYLDEIIEVADKEEYLTCRDAMPADAVIYEFNMGNKRNSNIPSHPGVIPAPYKTDAIKLLHCFTRPYGLQCQDETPQFYLDPESPMPELPDKYVVFHCTSNSKHRQWQQGKWNQLAKKCIDAGFHVVEIGIVPVVNLKSDKVIHQNGVVDLHIAAKIIRGSVCFIGMESGFGHMANSLGTPGVIITGKKRDDLPEYNLYTGNYSEYGTLGNLVRFYGQFPDAVPVQTVWEITERTLLGEPLSYDECTIYCLREQLKKLKSRWSFRLTEPFYSLQSRFCLTLMRNRRKR
ncbi:MAG: glycosyltransferase family 9 protein [Lentisphaeria bacterium]|nr:glycosyltransferase family 9 protein [Lentisphaeria bacterium]